MRPAIFLGCWVGKDCGVFSIAALAGWEQPTLTGAPQCRVGRTPAAGRLVASTRRYPGSLFTAITKGGVFGSLLSPPIINPPQVSILGVHKIEQRPVVNNEIVIHPMMYIALTYDHRIVDGREAVQLLAALKRFLEDPEELLLAG